MSPLHLRFLGHAAFDLRLGATRLLLDPHKPGAVGGRLQLPPIVGPFDAIVATHNHEDHNAWDPAFGTARWLQDGEVFAGIEVRTRPVFHDAQGGVQMGLSRMVSLTWQGLRVVHSGDIGAFDAADVAWMRGTDVLLLAAGGTYTLGPAAAAELARQAAPRVVVPMHCADPRVALSLASVDDFVRAYGGPVARAPELTQPWPVPLQSVVLLEPP